MHSTVRRLGQLAATVTLTAAFAPRAVAQALPDAKDLIARYAKEVGGDAWKAHKSARMKATVEIAAMNMRAEIEAVNLFPNLFMTRMTIPGLGEVQTGYDGTNAWSKDPAQGARILQGAEADQVAEEAEPDVATRMSARIVGSETVEKTSMNGRECYKVKHTWKSGRVTHDCFGVSDGLLVATIAKQTSAMGEMEVTTFHSEYKDFGGVKRATVMSASLMGAEMKTTVTSWEWDTVTDKDLELPADVKALIRK